MKSWARAGRATSTMASSLAPADRSRCRRGPCRAWPGRPGAGHRRTHV